MRKLVIRNVEPAIGLRKVQLQLAIYTADADRVCRLVIYCSAGASYLKRKDHIRSQ
jgi:hypothetical protein